MKPLRDVAVAFVREVGRYSSEWPPAKGQRRRGRAILSAPLQLIALSHPCCLGQTLAHAWLELSGFNWDQHRPFTSQ